MIQGGEEYIWAAYGISWIAFALYTLSLVSRLKSAEQEEKALGLENDSQ